MINDYASSRKLNHKPTVGNLESIQFISHNLQNFLEVEVKDEAKIKRTD